MYFSCIRQRGGWNNNPSAAQFRHTYRRTLVHAQVMSSKNANVMPQLQGICLSRSQGEDDSCTSSDATDHKFTCTLTQSLLEHDYTDLSVFSSEVVHYIGGFVAGVVLKRLHCADCAQLLVSDTKRSMLTALKNNGGFIQASAFVHAALYAAEKVIRLGTTTGKSQIDIITLRGFQNFSERHVSMLNSMHHYHEEPQHVVDLTKVFQRKYVVLRLRALARRITDSTRGAYVRHILTKQVLFAHQ